MKTPLNSEQRLARLGKYAKKRPKRDTNYKKTLKIAKAEVLGKLEAEEQWGKGKKGIMRQLTGFFKKAINRIEPLDLTAIGCATYVIHETWIDNAIAQILGIETSQIKNEAAKWALSFLLGYVLVKFFGQIAIATAEIGKSMIDLLRTIILAGAVSGSAVSGSVGGLSKATAFFMSSTALITLMPYELVEDYGTQWLQGEKKPIKLR